MEKEKFLYFWGAVPKGVSIGKECLSQWYYAPFTYAGVTFDTCEHWMMYQKALLFEDTYSANRVLQAKTPKEAKRIGRQVKSFNPRVWDSHKKEIVYKGNLYKFGTNPQLKAFITSFDDNVTFVEASPYDRIWGIGLTEFDPRAKSRDTWHGQNLLGEALTKVAKDLREE